MSDENKAEVEVEGLSEDQLAEILTQSPDTVALQITREDVRRIRAVKVSDLEADKIARFQEYLYRHPEHYISDNCFSSLFVYCFNLTYTLHKQAAEQEAKREGISG